jgi:hypothetical protein
LLFAAVRCWRHRRHASGRGLRHARHHGRRPEFFSGGGGSSPIDAHHRELCRQLCARHHRHEHRRAAALSRAPGNGQALRYGIGVGRDGFRWGGVHRISAKKEWPSWTPPSQMLARRPDLPRHMAGGIDNPLGARAMYLGSTLYRIHGSNEPETIGQAVSSGCFRMTNDDVTDLYEPRLGRHHGGREELTAQAGTTRIAPCARPIAAASRQ